MNGSAQVLVLTDTDLIALLKTCNGKTFANRRDEALFRIFAGLHSVDAMRVPNMPGDLMTASMSSSPAMHARAHGDSEEGYGTGRLGDLVLISAAGRLRSHVGGPSLTP